MAPPVPQVLVRCEGNTSQAAFSFAHEARFFQVDLAAAHVRGVGHFIEEQRAASAL
jgi:hypothetical protein